VDPPAAPRPPATGPAATVAPASKEIVTARDQAIVEAVKIRPRSTEGLLEVLPIEPGQTSEQRRVARDSAIIRLRVKKLIVLAEQGWVPT
jgi:hypothetical protein